MSTPLISSVLQTKNRRRGERTKVAGDEKCNNQSPQSFIPVLRNSLEGVRQNDNIAALNWSNSKNYEPKNINSSLPAGQ